MIAQSSSPEVPCCHNVAVIKINATLRRFERHSFVHKLFLKCWLSGIKADKARGFLPNLLTPLMYGLMKVSHILVVNLLQSFAAVTAGLAACKGWNNSRKTVELQQHFITIYDNIFCCVCFDNIKVLVYTQSYGRQVVVLAMGTKQSEPNSEERQNEECE